LQASSEWLPLLTRSPIRRPGPASGETLTGYSWIVQTTDNRSQLFNGSWRTPWAGLRRRLAYGLQYGCSKGAAKRISALSLVRRFTCKMAFYRSGRCWVRTSVLLLVSSASSVTFRTGMSGNSAILQHFCLRRADLMSAWYRTVPSQLQYGCSTSIRATLGPLTLCVLLESATYDVSGNDRNREHLRAWLPWVDTNRTVQDRMISKWDHEATGPRVPRSSDERG
jgi:hypothetical protein